jgi:hypothetical protein
MVADSSEMVPRDVPFNTDAPAHQRMTLADGQERLRPA